MLKLGGETWLVGVRERESVIEKLLRWQAWTFGMRISIDSCGRWNSKTSEVELDVG